MYLVALKAAGIVVVTDDGPVRFVHVPFGMFFGFTVFRDQCICTLIVVPICMVVVMSMLLLLFLGTMGMIYP